VLAINCAHIASLWVAQPNDDGIVEVMSDLSLDVWAASMLVAA
jgi:hypothetical protein